MLYHIIESLALLATFTAIWPAVIKLKNNKIPTYSLSATLISLLGIIAWLGWAVEQKDWFMALAAFSIILGELYIVKILLKNKKFILLLPLLLIFTSLFYIYHFEYLISFLLIISVILHLLHSRSDSTSHSPLRWLLESSEELLWAATFLLSGEITLALPALLHIPLALLLAYRSSSLTVNFFKKFTKYNTKYTILSNNFFYLFFSNIYYHQTPFYALTPEGNG